MYANVQTWDVDIFIVIALFNWHTLWILHIQYLDSNTGNEIQDTMTRGNKDFFNCYTFIEYHLHGNHLYHFNVICKTSIAELEWWPSKGFRSVHATIWREMPAKVKKAPLWFFSCYKQRLGIIAQCFTELGLDMLVMWTVFIALYFCVVAMFWYGLHSGKLQYILIVLNVLFSIQAIWYIYIYILRQGNTRTICKNKIMMALPLLMRVRTMIFSIEFSVICNLG